MKLTMQGRLAECYLLSFRVPQEQVKHLVPSGLTLVTRDSWAFWNVVLCQIENMRPLAFPRGTGMTYNHVAYRLMTECQLGNHTKLAGLFFVRSDSNDALMATMGNCVTDFQFHHATIRFETRADDFRATVVSKDTKGDLYMASDEQAPNVAGNSIFESEEERKHFLKYNPVGLATNEDGSEVKLSEVMRDEAHWVEKEVNVTHFDSQFLAPYQIQLERATKVQPLDYRWKLGRKLKLKHPHPARRLSRSMEESYSL